MSRKKTIKACKCNLPGIDDFPRKIIKNIKASGQTPKEFTPKIREIKPADWVTRCNCDDPQQIVAQAHLQDNEGDWYSCTVEKVFVNPKARGQGLGRQVVEEVVEMAKSRPDRCQILTADIDRNNPASRNIFEKQGFKIAQTFCVPGDNTKADVLRMTLPTAVLGPCKPDKPVKE